MATSKRIIAVASIIIIAMMAIFAFGIYMTEYSKKPIVMQKVKSADINYLYNFYLRTIPNIEGREYYGNSNASISIIAFVDLSSENSKNFALSVFPALKRDFIDKGKVRYYHKSYITSQDYREQSKTYLNAKALHCVGKINKDKFYNIYFDFIENVDKEIGALLNINKISSQLFEDCMKNNDFKEIIEDMSETENFGLVGISPRFYIGIGDDYTIIDGVPSYNRFRTAIRQYQLILGD